MAQQLPKGAAGKELQQALLPSEQILGWAEGYQGAHLVLTDQRVLFVKVGRSTNVLIGGRKTLAFPYRALSGVEVHTTIRFKYVLLLGPSIPLRLNDITRQVYADNACPFTSSSEQAFRALVAILQQKIQAAPTTPAATQAPSIPEQIQQLAQLRDQNILSTEEFEAKKAELLSRM